MRTIFIVPQTGSIAGVITSVAGSGQADTAAVSNMERTKCNRGSAPLLQTALKASTRVEMEKICIAL